MRCKEIPEQRLERRRRSASQARIRGKNKITILSAWISTIKRGSNYFNADWKVYHRKFTHYFTVMQTIRESNNNLAKEVDHLKHKIEDFSMCRFGHAQAYEAQNSGRFKWSDRSTVFNVYHQLAFVHTSQIRRHVFLRKTLITISYFRWHLLSLGLPKFNLEAGKIDVNLSKSLNIFPL